MAKKDKNIYDPTTHRIKKKTTIGSSVRSRPLNKHKRLNWKQYRGQGR